MFWGVVGVAIMGSIGGLLGAVLFYTRKSLFSQVQSMLVVSFAAGVMLATAFLDILPEALELGGFSWWAVFGGIIFLFFLEKSLVWYHHHGDECASHTPLLINLGDTLHNFIDGIVMGAAFLASPSLGIITALAVAAHEIPHEMADFAVMVSMGWSRQRAMLANFISALASVAGAVGIYFFRDISLSWLLAFAGGMFIYLACSDLIPALHRGHNPKNNFYQMLTFVFGIIVIWALQKAL